MYKSRKIAVVVPAFNEESHIANVIHSAPPYVDLIIVVDDCSTDRTTEVVETIKDPRVMILTNAKNQGVGGAIITGHKKAIELGVDIDVVMAGDNQMDPKYLPLLLDAIVKGKYDYVKGNRFIKHGYLNGMPKYRATGNVVLTFMTKIATGYWNVFDPQNGYTAIRTSVLRELDLDEIAKGYQFENDMLFHLGLINARVKDVSIPSVYNNQKSKIKLHKFVFETSVLLSKRLLQRIYRKYFLFNFHPIALLILIGVPLFIGSTLFSIYLLVRRYFLNPFITPSTGSVMLAVVPFLMSLQLILTALILDINETPR